MYYLLFFLKLFSSINIKDYTFCGLTKNKNKFFFPQSRMDIYMSQNPAGTSVQNILHWTQVQLLKYISVQVYLYYPWVIISF